MEDELEKKLSVLANHVWENEIRAPEIEAWMKNFTGACLGEEKEAQYSKFMLSRFMYFGKRLVREMLKSLYRDNFAAPLRQRIRRNCHSTRDVALINRLFEEELRATKFIGVGNPSESGAHLLYYFRQVNSLTKDRFADINSAFTSVIESKTIKYLPRDPGVTRYVFFDDLVGSGDQASQYLANELSKIRRGTKNLDIQFLSLFATTEGLRKLNSRALFNGKASTLFELDGSFKAFGDDSRYFAAPPDWFDFDEARQFAEFYGRLLCSFPLGYGDNQLLLGFSHNTPDNTLPIFWRNGGAQKWFPVFMRFQKM